MMKTREKAKSTESETQQILSELVSMIKSEVQYENFTFYPITDKIVISSRFVIQDYNIAASDALHVFIAAAAECDYFISTDKKLVLQLTKESQTLAHTISE
jgi:predicted nucleic acid-binding protein